MPDTVLSINDVHHFKVLYTFQKVGLDPNSIVLYLMTSLHPIDLSGSNSTYSLYSWASLPPPYFELTFFQGDVFLLKKTLSADVK